MKKTNSIISKPKPKIKMKRIVMLMLIAMMFACNKKEEVNPNNLTGRNLKEAIENWGSIGKTPKFLSEQGWELQLVTTFFRYSAFRNGEFWTMTIGAASFDRVSPNQVSLRDNNVGAFAILEGIVDGNKVTFTIIENNRRFTSDPDLTAFDNVTYNRILE